MTIQNFRLKITSPTLKLRAIPRIGVEKDAPMAAFTVKGNPTGGTIGPQDTTSPVVTTLSANASIISPVIAGGGGANSTLSFESTYGVGSGDALIFATGSQTERMRISSDGAAIVTTGAASANVDAYGNGATTAARAGVAVTNRDSSASTGKERYAGFFGEYSNGTGDGTVPASTYGLGVTSYKNNWDTTTVAGQMHGLSIVTRGGFHGTELNPPNAGTSGDSAAIVTNTVVSDVNSFGAILEGVVYFFPNGVATPGSVMGIDCQIGGLTASAAQNGYYTAALSGGLKAAYAATNSQTSSTGPGTWTYFLQYEPDLGAGVYNAFLVNQAGHIVMNNGPGAGVPNKNKTIRVGNGGDLEVVNSAGSSVIVNITDAGALNITTGYSIGNTTVLDNAGWTAFTPAVTVTGGTGTGAGRFKRIGKTVHFTVTVTITATGTNAAVALPVAASGSASTSYAAGREQATTGNMYTGLIQTGGTTMTIFRYDNNASFVNGYVVVLSGSYEGA